MAIPNDLFRQKFGVAVMLYDAALAEWFFLCWATKNAVVVNLAPGNYSIALWLINGDNSGQSTVSYDGTSVVYVMRARR